MNEENETKVWKVLYDSYFKRVQSFHNQLNETLQLWDGTKIINNGSSPDYQMQKIYQMKIFPMDDVREIISKKFDGLEQSVKKVLNTFGELTYEEMNEDDISLVAKYSANLRQFHSSVVLNKYMYFNTGATELEEDTYGLATVACELYKISKDIKSFGDINVPLAACTNGIICNN